MGGTEPSRRPAGREGASRGGFCRLRGLVGRGEETRGVDGEDVCFGTVVSTAGGVGRRGAGGTACLVSEAEES
jgi:hypothetical protein